VFSGRALSRRQSFEVQTLRPILRVFNEETGATANWASAAGSWRSPAVLLRKRGKRLGAPAARIAESNAASAEALRRVMGPAKLLLKAFDRAAKAGPFHECMPSNFQLQLNGPEGRASAWSDRFNGDGATTEQESFSP
jgi:hypothetical protein